MRLIEQDAILDRNICFDIECDNCSFVNGDKCKLRQRVFAMPTIDAEPVRHGHWKEKRKYEVGRAVDDDGWVELQELCSACGKWAKTQWRSPLYCPNCGARMSAEDNT